MAFEELLDWAGNRSPWQQDTLRRAALHGELTDDDLAALRLQIEQAAGLPAEDVPDPVPLAAEHLSDAAGNDPKTVLASLGPVRHVDRLAPDQPPLRFASLAYVLLCALRRIGLAHTRFADATCGSLRLHLLKSGALVRTSVRRIKIAMASAYPWQPEWALAHARLTNAAA